MEQVEKTNTEAEIKKYRKNLLKITHFKAPEYRPRRWIGKETKKIPLESEEILKDPRLIKCKMPPTFPDTEMSEKKIRKPFEDPELNACSNNTKEDKIQNIVEDPTSTMEGIILHVTDSELNLFPENTEDSTNTKATEDCANVKDKRRVYLYNNWQVKDSIGSPELSTLVIVLTNLLIKYFRQKWQNY